MNLTSDIIGTDPKYPKVVNQDWLKVDPRLYDNYPSDNNPVRVLPELAKMWDHGRSPCGLVPNEGVQQLGLRTAEKEEKADKEACRQVIREAKKAVMAGMTGSVLAEHLRARFAKKHLEAAAEGLKKVSEEIGLLGNVYIDASAFDSYEEAKQFLRQHSHRLARDLLFDTETMNPHVVSMIASDFRKNVVSSINYDEKLFQHYKNHLVSDGRIPKEAVIDSKEALKIAFLYRKPAAEDPKPKGVKRASAEEKAELYQQYAEKRAEENREASDAILLKKIQPIISYAQETLSNGKSKEALKEMLRSRYAMADIQDASQPLAIVVSPEGLTAKHVDSLLEDGSISTVMAEELKKIGKKFPVKKSKFEDWKPSSKTVGVQGYLYSPTRPASDEHDSYRAASVEALKKGFEPDRIRTKLLEKLSAEEADKVLSDAVSAMNSTAAGAVANAAPKPKKKAIIEDPRPRQTLPDEKTTIEQTKEIISTFAGAEMIVDVDPAPSSTGLEIEMDSNGFELPD